ncbi:MAG TPA: glycosyltransferase family 1 protein [Flavisolibacter sp.]|nr:glycosyltransferase family 1 protein [Flavisolibacter sp.]
MIIAINTRFLLNELEGYGNFIQELFRALVKDHPEHQFYFLFDRPFDQKYVFSSNVHPVIVSPPARHPVLWKYWYDVKIPLALKKIKADVFVSPDGYCSLTTKTPQCLVVHDLGFLYHSEAYKKSHVSFLKRNTPKYLNKAKSIVTVSQFSKDDILKHYKIEAAKIDVVYNGVKDIFRPLSFDEKDAVKEKYTEGKEYFLYLGEIQPRKNLVSLLKAFSIFKKRLQSSMKLVIAGRLAWKNEEFLQLIQTYKYRSDVILTGYIPEEELPSLIGTAYALVYPSFFEGFGVPVVEAMKCEVPVLTSEKTSMQEVAGEAGLYFNPNDHTDIADKMMLVYKDENLRKQLIEKGKLIAGRYNWKTSAELFWQSILKAVNL